jgi:hypothetical protein
MRNWLFALQKLNSLWTILLMSKKTLSMLCLPWTEGAIEISVYSSCFLPQMLKAIFLFDNTGFGLITEFIQSLILLTTDNYNVFTNLHNLQIIIAYLKWFQSIISSSTCCLVEPPTKGAFVKVFVLIISGFRSLLALHIALSRPDVSQLLCAYSLLQKCVLTSHCMFDIQTYSTTGT